METNIESKLQKIGDRIAAIQFDLESHRESIRFLLEAIKNNNIIKNTPFAPRVIKYSCIPRSERRFQWTLQYLRTKVKLLETELETLIKYTDWSESAHE